MTAHAGWPGSVDPDVTQAIGLHRRGEAPTPRGGAVYRSSAQHEAGSVAAWQATAQQWPTDQLRPAARSRFRGFAAVLPWNWGRRAAR